MRGGSPAGDAGQDAITRNTEDLAASMQLSAYWETTGDLGDIDSGLCTPREVRARAQVAGYACDLGTGLAAEALDNIDSSMFNLS